MGREFVTERERNIIKDVRERGERDRYRKRLEKTLKNRGSDLTK